MFGYCVWIWDGVEWQNTLNACLDGKVCSEPSSPGVMVGDRQTTPCA